MPVSVVSDARSDSLFGRSSVAVPDDASALLTGAAVVLRMRIRTGKSFALASLTRSLVLGRDDELALVVVFSTGRTRPSILIIEERTSKFEG